MIAQSFRYWIADLITGGALTELDERAWRWRCDAEAKFYALRTIAAMPTPKANATVRRMARVAQEAVKP